MVNEMSVRHSHPVSRRSVAQSIRNPAYFPLCIECRAALATSEMSVRPSVRPSVRLSNAWIVTKRKKVLPRFLYHPKDHLSWFCHKKNAWWRATPSTWNFGSNWPRWSENVLCVGLRNTITSVITASTSAAAATTTTNVLCSTSLFPGITAGKVGALETSEAGSFKIAGFNFMAYGSANLLAT